MESDLPFYVALSQAPGIGLIRFKVLVENFKSVREVWESSDKLLKQILDPAVFEKFNKFRQSVDPEKVLADIYRKDIKILTLLDKTYPEKLKEIFDPPPVLYIKGELKPEDNLALAVVGTRRITNYGREVTEILVRELASSGLTIVSGLARGVDSLAHKTALEVGSRTIAVLGCGVDIVYPAQNVLLAKEIVKNGALVSEYPPGTQPIPGHFPARNRIISGLSLGTLVTEADEKSGSLITASQALEQNREVFAVPGPIYSQLSKGPSGLIKQGAKLVTTATDILEELNIEQKQKAEKVKQIIPDNIEEETIIKLLVDEPKHIDELLRESKFSSNKLNGLLVTMELKGKISCQGNGSYRLQN